jgi:hypothetical protein
VRDSAFAARSAALAVLCKQSGTQRVSWERSVQRQGRWEGRRTGVTGRHPPGRAHASDTRPCTPWPYPHGPLAAHVAWPPDKGSKSWSASFGKVHGCRSSLCESSAAWAPARSGSADHAKATGSARCTVQYRGGSGARAPRLCRCFAAHANNPGATQAPELRCLHTPHAPAHPSTAQHSTASEHSIRAQQPSRARPCTVLPTQCTAQSLGLPSHQRVPGQPVRLVPRCSPGWSAVCTAQRRRAQL